MQLTLQNWTLSWSRSARDKRLAIKRVSLATQRWHAAWIAGTLLILAAPAFGQEPPAPAGPQAPGEPQPPTEPAAPVEPAAEAATESESTAPESEAATEPSPAVKPLPENMDLEVPPVTPAEVRTYRTHRGFYLGVSAGFGHNSGSYDDGSSEERLEAEGFNLAMDLKVGYGASPGLGLGGAVIADFLTSSSFEAQGFRTDGSSVSLLVGPFVDGFPDTHGPLHLGGSLGLAHVRAFSVTGRVADEPVDRDMNATGVGFAGWIGVAPWVSDRFSIGAQFRIMANFTGIGSEESASTRSFNLMLNAVHF